MEYVIGIDLGTSAVKLLLVNRLGSVVQEVSKPYPLIQEKSGYSEQDPEDWVRQTIAGITELIDTFKGEPGSIKGISFSGQMHGLVLLDENHEVLRNAILWNDTRTTAQCEEIYQVIGKEKLVSMTQNLALEGFTLPKLLWVKKYEAEIYRQVHTFLLPKDYVRYRLTGIIQMDYSDAAGTLLLDVKEKQWSKTICDLLQIDPSICPPLVDSFEFVGNMLPSIASQTGLYPEIKVFAGGADNACGAIGAGIIEEGKILCSIGTSGVVLSFEAACDQENDGKVHFFNHSVPNAYYSMGVTLAAGYSLSWFKDTFAADETFEQLISEVTEVPVGSNGLLFTPYLVGERTPHVDSTIRGSFTGIDSKHKRKHFVRAALEGITFSLNETVQIFRENGKEVNKIVSIGGGAKNETWLQMQADIFNAKVIKLSNEQGPGMGAAMIAAYGCQWFPSFQECTDTFLGEERYYLPNPKNVQKYEQLFSLYKQVYSNLRLLHEQLKLFRD